MKTKNLFLLLLLLVGLGSSVSAQNRLSENEIKAFKSNVQKVSQSTKSIQSDFTQTKKLSVLDNTIISKGHLAFKAPNLVKWEYTTPYKNSAIFKDDKLLVNNEGKKDEMDLSSNRLFRSLNTLIVNSIKGDMFDETQFEISYFSSGAHYLVKFIPKDKRLKKFISTFELKFDKTSSQVNEVKLIEPNDDYTVIEFKNKQINSTIPESVFKQ